MSASEPATILVADDDPELRKMLIAALRNAGYQVVEAHDGDQTLQRVRQQPPDLLLLDVWMPGADGLAILEALKHDTSANRTITLLLTGDPEADARLEALAAGASGCLSKGISIDHLLEQVAICLAQRRNLLDPGGHSV